MSKMASYKKTWSSEAQQASDIQYIKLRSLSEALTALEAKNWSLVEHRQECFDIWKGIQREFPVAVDKQFPEYTTYINTAACEFPKVVAQFLAAISYKESSKVRNEPEKSVSKSVISKLDIDHPMGTLVTFASDDDARKAFYESLHSLRTMLSTPGCVTDRGSFEKKYSLKWES